MGLKEVGVHVIEEVKANWTKLVDSLELPASTVDNERQKPVGPSMKHAEVGLSQ